MDEVTQIELLQSMVRTLTNYIVEIGASEEVEEYINYCQDFVGEENNEYLN